MRAYALSLALLATPAAAANEVDRLFAALEIDEVMDILSEEGSISAADLEEGMFPGRGGAAWQAEITRIYDVETRAAQLRSEMTRALDGADVTAMLDFLESETGSKIMALEVSARRAFIDPEMEEIAAERFADAETLDPALHASVAEFTELNSLVEQNVAGAFASNAAFALGAHMAGGFPGLSAEQLTAELWAGEDAVTSDVSAWLYAYLMTAYDPLTEGELNAYVDFSRTAAGQELNEAIMDGFGIVFAEISFDLGSAAGRFMAQQDL